MDIQYLLFLQNIRESMPNFVNMIFYFISEIGVISGVIISMLVFWCVSKETGFFVSLSFSGGTYFNQIIKNTACVYRPWVRDASVQPFSKSFKSATGYSFPSGHSVTAASSLGTCAFVCRKKKVTAILLVIFALLVGFARNYLGCHTPQDVIVGLSIGFVFVVLMSSLIKWVSKDDSRDKYLLIGSAVLAVVMIIFCEAKPYPLDYLDGKLICDPEPMKFDCYQAAGYLFGLILAWFIEKRFVKFEIDAVFLRKVIRVVVGFALFAVVHYVIGHAIRGAIGDKVGKLVSAFLDQMFVFLGYPAMVKCVQRMAGKKGE